METTAAEAAALAALAAPPPSSTSNPGRVSAWGSASRQSCDDLIDRLERNDPLLKDVVILPAKRFGPAEVERLAALLERQHDSGVDRKEDGGDLEDNVVAARPDNSASCSDYYHWRSLSASSHALPPESLARLGRAVAASSARAISSNEQRPRGPALVGLAIGDESTGDDGIRALCLDGFLTIPNGSCSSSLSLVHLDLSHKGMTGLGLADIVASLRGSQKLRQLNVSRNDFSDALQALEPLWKHHDESVGNCHDWFPALEDLDVSHCNLEPAFVDEFFQRLGRTSSPPVPATTTAVTAATTAPPPPPVLLRLRLAGNPSLADSGLKALWKWHWDRLRVLDASHCGLGDGAVLALCHHVQSCPESVCGGRTCPLEILNLSDNSIGSAGASVLGPWLGSSSSASFLPHLVELHMARNPLGGDGVLALVNGLKDRHHSTAPAAPTSEEAVPPPRVRVLDVSSTDCSAAAAFRAIRDSGVETLLLHGNRLGNIVEKKEEDGPSVGGFDVLSPALRGGHPTIRYLDLSQNGADQGSVVSLLESLLLDVDVVGGGAESPFHERIGPSVLATLVVGGNEVGPDVDAAVARVQQRHPRLVVPRR
jgi:Leucine Rich repeat